MTLLLILVSGLIGWLIGKDSGQRSAEREMRTRYVQHLTTEAEKEPSKDVARGLRRAIEVISGLSVFSPATHVVTPTAPSPKASQVSVPVANAVSKPVDSVSTLLYFGAFLIIAGVGLFVGLSDYSGNAKTTVVGLMALLFYISGLLMHDFTRRLKPAALAITAIGLICLPLTGAAAYAYVWPDSGAGVWFATSLVSLALYVLALWRIRQSLLGYLSVFMCLSLWLSIVSVLDAPLYFFGWAMILIGIIYLLAKKYLKLWDEVEQPLTVSAAVMVPAALVVTFLFGMGTITTTQQAVTVLLASVFYAVACWLETRQDVRKSYFTMSYSLLPIGTWLLVYAQHQSWIDAAFAVTAVSVVQLLVVLLLKKMSDDWRQVGLRASALLMLGASVLGVFSWNWKAFALLLTVNTVVHVAVSLRIHSEDHATLALLDVVALPWVVGFFVAQPQVESAVMSAVYIALAIGLMLFGHAVRKLEYTKLTAVAYAVSLFLAWIISVPQSGVAPALITTIVGLVVAVSAYYEHQPKVLGIAMLLWLCAVLQWLPADEHPALVVGLWWGAIGLAAYAIGKLEQYVRKNNTFAGVWLVSGVAAILAGSLYGFIVDQQATWMSITLLGTTGALVCYESLRRNLRPLSYIGAAVMMIALQLGLYKSGLHNTQLYTHLWAGYFAGLAWLTHRSKLADEQQNYTILALGAVTIPLAVQALGGDTGYGLQLLFESIGIMLIGLWLRYRLVAWWGLATAVGSVLYQLRDYQFIVLVLLGVGIIALGVFLLLRQDKNKQ